MGEFGEAGKAKENPQYEKLWVAGGKRMTTTYLKPAIRLHGVDYKGRDHQGQKNICAREGCVD